MSKNTDLGSLVNYIKGQVTGRLNAPAYTSATAFTGTIAGYLGFDTSGNILTSTGSGVNGSGTTNYIPKFTASGTIGNSQIYDDGTNIDIGNTNGSVGKLNVTGRIALTNSLFFSSNLTSEDRWEINVATPANDLYFTRSGVGERLRITSGGNLGVGTTNPFSDTNFVSTYIGGSSGGQLILGNSTGGSANRYMLLQGDSGAASFLAVGAIPLIFYTNGSERMRLDSSGRFGLGTTSTSGYAMTVTNVDSTIYGPSSSYRIFARFVNNTTDNRGVGIGYNIAAAATYVSCLYSLGQAAQDANNGLALGCYSTTNANYIVKLYVNPITVYMDLPSSTAGLTSGQLWRDGSGYVRQV